MPQKKVLKVFHLEEYDRRKDTYDHIAISRNRKKIFETLHRLYDDPRYYVEGSKTPGRPVSSYKTLCRRMSRADFLSIKAESKARHDRVKLKIYISNLL